MSRLWIAGSRSFSAEVLGFARDARMEVVGLLEPRDRLKVGHRVHGQPVSWLDEAEAEEGDSAIVGTGDPDRVEVTERLVARGFSLATVVHPAAHVPPTARVGAGSIVAPGVVLGEEAALGDHVVVGRGSLVGHHTVIGDFATLGPGSNVAGNVRIEAGAFLGMAAVVRDHVSIGESAVVAMGAVVVGDVAAGAQVRGLPAR